MKRLILLLAAVLLLVPALRAQENTFGFRAGYGAAVSTELSYQRFTNDINRVEFDLGLRFPSTYKRGEEEYRYPMGPTFSTAYHWHWFLVGGFGVYGGPALQFSLPYWHQFSMGAGGQVGMDIQFDAPFQVALDFRPIYNLFGPFRGFDPLITLAVHYAF